MTLTILIRNNIQTLLRCLILPGLFFTSYSSAQIKIWTLQTSDTKIVLGINATQHFELKKLATVNDDFNWAGISRNSPFVKTVGVDGRRYNTDWKFAGSTIDEKDGTTLKMVFKNSQPEMELTSVWHAWDGPGPIRNSQFIKNISGKSVNIFAVESIDLNLSVPPSQTKLMYINDDASIPDSVGVYKDALTNSYHKELRISEVQDWIPFMALNDDDKHGVYIGWEWSIGRLSFTKNSESQGHLKAGISDDFKTEIAAGETFEVPPAFVGAYKGDFDACGNSLRKYLFHNAMPAMVRDSNGFPKAQWNAFAALGKEKGGWDPVESKYYPLIDDIAPLGFEELVIDVGWWSSYGDPGHIITDSVDWPHGIPAAAKYAKDRGIRFGLYDNESENLTSDSGKSERISDISYLIEDLHADFYRSDATAGPVIAGTYGKGQRAKFKEDVSYWSIKGFYDVIDSVYRKIPGFLWENCSSGGGLKDFGAVQRAARVQNQDVYYPVQARRSFYDASHVFPPMQLASVVGSWLAWYAEGSVYEFRSASMGAAYWHPDAPNGGNGGPVWTDEQKAKIKKAVTTYKEKLRPLIRTADLYHIFPRPDSVHWDGVQYFDPVKGEGVVYMFKPAPSTPDYTIKLKGLKADDFYDINFEDDSNPAVTLKGGALMDEGIKVILKGELVSELMFITKNKLE